MHSQQICALSMAADAGQVGGKASALGKLLRAGFIVPDGFVVLADRPGALTPALSDAILRAFDALGAEFVAVRSSAINEDGIDAAWAGQLDTFLNCSRENIVQRVQACRESADTARAQSYAQQKGVESTKVAVLVQAMIDSEVSGVAFSAHPVTGDTAQLVIEAGFGLGEAIVSGQITPDTYIFDKQNGRLVDKHIAAQAKKLVRSSQGTTVWEELGNAGNAQKLSDEQIAQLCAVTEKLEGFFGYPVDVEWALSGETIYVLQCRPITTL